MSALGAPGLTTARVQPATRARLGVPDDATTVMVVTESSHWDPNWMYTSEQYLRRSVVRTLDMVLDQLDADGRRVWSADCVFFLARYWQLRPANRQRLVDHLNSGQLRLTNSGVTTPDTVITPTESILRDFLLGQQWLESIGVDQQPSVLYLPDCFGHSGALPSLALAAGFDRVAMARIDGGRFPGSDWDLWRRQPRAGSGAEALVNAGSNDFIWRDASGQQVLAHWHPYTYSQGDRFDTRALLRVGRAQLPLGRRGDAAMFDQLDGQAARLKTLARTAYVVCPIGHDFTHPKVGLMDMLDAYNNQRYPHTGMWVVNAGLDDYLDLVDGHRDDLPVIDFDPNPYWTGFYSSRPNLKFAHRRLVDELLATEAESVADELTAPVGASGTRRLGSGPDSAWWAAVVANHHDFVTGTSPDRVVHDEQEPWLRAATAAVLGFTPPGAQPAASAQHGPSVSVDHSATVVRVDTGRLVAVFDPTVGGCITELTVDAVPVSAGLMGDLVAHHDSGGLWRMGCEYWGGRFHAIDRVSHRPATVEVIDTAGGGVAVTVTADLDGRPTWRSFMFAPGSASVSVWVSSSAGDHRTVTLSSAMAQPARSLVMDTPGGTIHRPLIRHYQPTFWPVSSWLKVLGGNPGVTVGVDMARAVSVSPHGQLDVVVARNANREKAWGVLGFGAFPATGHDPSPTVAALDLQWGDDAQPGSGAPGLPVAARQRFDRAAGRLFAIESMAAPVVSVTAIKPASRGPGVVVRLGSPGESGSVRVRLACSFAVASAALCDARERDLQPLEVTTTADGAVVGIDVVSGITSVRLVPQAMATQAATQIPGATQIPVATQAAT